MLALFILAIVFNDSRASSNLPTLHSHFGDSGKKWNSIKLNAVRYGISCCTADMSLSINLRYPTK